MGLNDLQLTSQMQAVSEAVASAKQLIKEAPTPSRHEAVKLAYAHAVILQQVTMSLLLEAKALTGHKQLARLEAAAKLGKDAADSFSMVIKHLPKEQVIEMEDDQSSTSSKR